jgi:hypothetical protein
MTVLYPSPMTRRTIELAIANHKLILWIYDNLRTLYYNPTISVGPLAGATCTPSDGGLAFGADFVVRGGVDGFAAAARAAGLYVGNGLSSEFEDNAAAQVVWGGLTFVRARVVSGF